MLHASSGEGHALTAQMDERKQQRQWSRKEGKAHTTIIVPFLKLLFFLSWHTI